MVVTIGFRFNKYLSRPLTTRIIWVVSLEFFAPWYSRQNSYILVEVQCRPDYNSQPHLPKYLEPTCQPILSPFL
jgi:hypothetical protein